MPISSERELKAPWMNGSRMRLFTIWLPYQIVAITLVTILAYYVFKIPRTSVSIHNTQLMYVGILLLEYYIFIVFKDLVIMVSQIFFGGYMGFWHAIVLHILSTPLDIIVVLGLSIWGSAVLNQDGT